MAAVHLLHGQRWTPSPFRGGYARGLGRTRPSRGGRRARLDAVGFDAGREVFRAHEGGKLVVRSRMPLTDRESLSLAYTPGVAEVCTAIAEDETLARTYTWRSRLGGGGGGGAPVPRPGGR